MAERLARARLRAALRRRPLHPLHGRHHRACRRAWCGATRTCSSRSAAASTPSPNARVDRPRGAGREGAGQRTRSDDAADRAAHARRHAVGRDGRRVPSATRSCSSPSSTPRRGLEARRTTEKVNSIMITGDAMARPLIEALDEPGRRATTCRRCSRSASTAALFSPSVKDQFFELLPEPVFTDAIGSSEGGSNGYSIVEKGNTAMKGGPTVTPSSTPSCSTRTSSRCEPGSGRHRQGRAQAATSRSSTTRTRRRPRETFVTAPDGTRYSIPGDFATLEADGTITLLGRGSVSINSGGEKIFPEEVEGAVQGAPRGLRLRRRRRARRALGPARRRGRRSRATAPTPTLESIQEHCRTHHRRLQGAARAPPGRPDRALAVGQARLPVGEAGRDEGDRRHVGRRWASCRRSGTPCTRDGMIAYRILGSGPIDVVWVNGFASNLDMNDRSPLFGDFANRLPHASHGCSSSTSAGRGCRITRSAPARWKIASTTSVRSWTQRGSARHAAGSCRRRPDHADLHRDLSRAR